MNMIISTSFAPTLCYCVLHQHAPSNCSFLRTQISRESWDCLNIKYKYSSDGAHNISGKTGCAMPLSSLLVFCLGIQAGITSLCIVATNHHAVHYAQSQPSTTQQSALSSAGPPSSTYGMCHGLSSSLGSLLLTSHLTCLTDSNCQWHPTLHMKRNNRTAYVSAIRAG